jgi:hypothetical protein
MAFTQNALVTFSLPATYADGITPWPPANYGSATVSLNGVQIGTVSAPALSYIASGLPFGADSFTVAVMDKVTGLTGAASVAFVYNQPGQPPGAPVITSIVAH